MPPNDKPSPDNKLELVVVVSGDPVNVSLNPHQKVENLIREALREAEAANQDPDGYLLTFDDRDVPADVEIGTLGLKDGDTLYLAPRQGIGG